VVIIIYHIEYRRAKVIRGESPSARKDARLVNATRKSLSFGEDPVTTDSRATGTQDSNSFNQYQNLHAHENLTSIPLKKRKKFYTHAQTHNFHETQKADTRYRALKISASKSLRSRRIKKISLPSSPCCQIRRQRSGSERVRAVNFISIPFASPSRARNRNDTHHTINGTGIAALAHGLPAATGMHDSHAAGT